MKTSTINFNMMLAQLNTEERTLVKEALLTQVPHITSGPILSMTLENIGDDLDTLDPTAMSLLLKGKELYNHRDGVKDGLMSRAVAQELLLDALVTSTDDTELTALMYNGFTGVDNLSNSSLAKYMMRFAHVDVIVTD